MDKFRSILGLILPGVLAAFGLPQQLGAAAIDAIAQGTTMKNATGAQKLSAVVNIALDTVGGIDAVRPNTIDPTAFTQAATAAISTGYDIASLIHTHAAALPPVGLPTTANLPPTVASIPG